MQSGWPSTLEAGKGHCQTLAPVLMLSCFQCVSSSTSVALIVKVYAWAQEICSLTHGSGASSVHPAMTSLMVQQGQELVNGVTVLEEWTIATDYRRCRVEEFDDWLFEVEFHFLSGLANRLCNCPTSNSTVC